MPVGEAIAIVCYQASTADTSLLPSCTQVSKRHLTQPQTIDPTSQTITFLEPPHKTLAREGKQTNMTSSDEVTPQPDLDKDSMHPPDNRHNNDSEPQLPQTPAPTGGAAEGQIIKHNIKVLNQRGDELYFALKPTTRMDKLMSTWYQRTESAPGTKRFLFEGRKLIGDETPASLEMEIEDTVEVYEEQVGGVKVQEVIHDQAMDMAFGLVSA